MAPRRSRLFALLAAPGLAVLIVFLGVAFEGEVTLGSAPRGLRFTVPAWSLVRQNVPWIAVREDSCAIWVGYPNAGLHPPEAVIHDLCHDGGSRVAADAREEPGGGNGVSDEFLWNVESGDGASSVPVRIERFGVEVRKPLHGDDPHERQWQIFYESRLWGLRTVRASFAPGSPVLERAFVWNVRTRSEYEQLLVDPKGGWLGFVHPLHGKWEVRLWPRAVAAGLRVVSPRSRSTP